MSLLQMIKTEHQRGLFIYQLLINRAGVWTAFSLTPKANFLFLLFLISSESCYALSGITLSSLYSISFLFSSLEQWKVLPKGETPLSFQIKLTPPSLTSQHFECIYWRRKWQPTPVFLPGKSHGWRSLVGYGPWGWKELDTTERLHFLSFLSF